MINKAIDFAVKAHRDQFRKGTCIPFILHPMEVGVIVSKMTSDEEIISAAFLHDTVEDCPHVSIEDIRREFGNRIASMVDCESEDKSRTWMERKSHTIYYLKEEASQEVRFIALGDKLANIRSLVKDYAQVGDQLWERFNMKDKKMQGWYYRSMIDSLSSMKEYPQYEEYVNLVHSLFGE
ncbi:MAG: HD domain-containing protein [Lachnospiraceae bacterium]|nr:HD domain-containing protein [Lachnospiraceae bacterium]